MMSGIRSRDTKPELLIRKYLHARGFRYRLHSRKIPGKPDIVLAHYRAAVFINGCFWHGHDCPLFKLPETRRDFWDEKISRNRERDIEVRDKLELQGWRHLTVWECAIRGPRRLGIEETFLQTEEWILGNQMSGEIRGGR